MAKFYFVKLFSSFIGQCQNLSRSEILTFLWFSIHADSRGNMVVLTPELYNRLLEFVKIKRPSMYNVLSKLQRKHYITKHGDIVMVNSEFANKHRQMKVETTPYNWSFTELEF